MLCSLAALLSLANQCRAADCESLSNLKLPDTTITLAQRVTDKTFTPGDGKPLTDLPEFCRVVGVIKPSSDSNIRFEVWLPIRNWNHKYRGMGNGGFAGHIDYDGLANSVRRNYAASGTDTGHEANFLDASWAYHHPEKVKDFGYRAVHLTAENGKAVIKAFYDAMPQHSYFDACSDGGREALMEAQRYPQDYDGILAGAPANLWTHLLSAGLAANQALSVHPDGYISQLKLPSLKRAVLDSCDAQDGLKDGIIDDPRKCHFDPATLLCHGEETRDCLTAPQVESVKAIYGGGRDSKGDLVFPGLMPGSEDGWELWVTGQAPGQSLGSGFLSGYFRYMVLEDPTWNPLTANIDQVMSEADKNTARALNSDQPGIGDFIAHGGKLIVYHGWNDAAISPLNSIRYYQSVITTIGKSTAANGIRLYMAPGVGHCIGGPGPSWFGQLGAATAKGPKYGIYDALEAWVEQGTAPGDIIATKYENDDPKGKVEMTRPLCPFPQQAKYRGSGDPNDYSNFSCAAP
ncbi:MAG: tannase/feruloyl esterase family alpha/beta hydrolase [Acidobacteriaceae bacterium]|nr:tannase/feruloyl esterase family alpha/beta hydrolase [Acidobacteriaceae bacterium]